MGAVVPLVRQSDVDEAWEVYCVLARQLAVTPHLIADRSYNEALARAHERWRRLFLAWDAPATSNVIAFPVPA